MTSKKRNKGKNGNNGYENESSDIGWRNKIHRWHGGV